MPLMEPLVLTDLWAMVAQPDQIDWQPFHPGVMIHRLYQDDSTGAAAALLRYAPGATVAPHIHSGFEHILVLAGSQQDQRGDYPVGTLVINPPETGHWVKSEAGCIVLAIWQRPVVFEGVGVAKLD
ncbi:cupin domain-containing protein [Spirulina sp. CCNP1310]|uniref:cupin domain-containing protein n=1 Tax=Spirulina sp. CCNP1310 TaxID=3110249 RepID=UPI002B218328|nr:cupin domain-containing protein [Spirulina sp. CCNP1310]